jgi:spermidine synthase
MAGLARRTWIWCLLASLLWLPGATARAQFDPLSRRYGALEHDAKSDFSHIRIRTRNQIRTLFFVRDSGEEVIESMVDLRQPERLLLDYTRHMFLSYVFQPKQEQVLIVGLGGGAMIHFLKKYDPEVKIDAVEIDPAIVRVADQHFNVRSEGNVNIITADGLRYLQETEERYDVIYMDAFLKPSAETDANGVPLGLKSADFYAKVQEKLRPGGVVVFNLNPHAGTREDVREITRAFGQVYVFRLSDSLGLVAVATMAKERLPYAEILKLARQLDTRFKATVSFERMATRLAR